MITCTGRYFWVVMFICILSDSKSQQRCEQIPTDNQCFGLLSDDYYVLRDLIFNARAIQELQVILEALQESERCTLFLKVLFCFYNFPPCDFNTSEALPICPQKCPEIDAVVEACHGILNVPTFQSIPNLSEHIDNFNCTNPSTYYPDIPPNTGFSSTSCTNITNLPLTSDENAVTSNVTNGTGSDELAGGAITGIIIGVIGFAAVLIIIIIASATYLVQLKKGNSRIRHVKMVYCHQSSLSQPIVEEGSRINDRPREVIELLQSIKGKFSDVLIPAESITKENLLGKGAYGIVYRGELTLVDGSTKPAAIKMIALPSLSAINDLVVESTIMKQFDHPNVLPLLGVCVDPDADDVFKIVLPFMANGDLRSFLKCSRVEPNKIDEFNDNISELKLLNMCLDIAKGMKYLVDKRFIHRDLAARNCMVGENHSIKVADFSLTKDVYITEYYRGDKQALLPVKWMAMESLLDQYFDEKTDVWSYGVTCWEIFSLGRTPYPGEENKNMIDVLKDGKRLNRPVLCPPELYTLMEATWQENPLERPSFDKLVTSLSQGIT